MGFATPAFVSLCLPLSFLACALLHRHIRWQNAVLLLFSLLFYAWGEPVFIFGLLALTLANGLLAQGIHRSRHKRTQNLLAGCAVLLNLGLLFAFKYAHFFVETLNALAGLSLPLPGIRLPLGISFFTFQALSYVLDVRRGKMPAPNMGRLLLYLSFFPQLVAGPIIQWHDIQDQFESRTLRLSDVAAGLRRFIIGLSKKILLADVLAMAADAAFASTAQGFSAPLAWYGAVAYTLQIYLDFSGYSDMAIGMGRMFGFSFPENFRLPLRADTVRNFWRRWHITLTQWFRDYLYIPLGGSRSGTAKTMRNLAIVFLFTGLWHGASWTFVLWGAWHGLFAILERIRVLKPEKWPRMLRHLYTLLVVLMGFVVFRADSLAHAAVFLRGMFSFGTLDALQTSTLAELCAPQYLCSLAIACAISLCRPRMHVFPASAQRWLSIAGDILCVCLLVCSYAAMVSSDYHPFIYFRF